MDHTLDELEECVYDYLSSHPNEPKTFMEIYDDISGTTGHRCSELQNLDNKIIYKDKFIMICYSLEKSYNNIYKVFKQNLPYLIFSTQVKTYDDLVEDLNISYCDALTYELNTIKLDNIIETLLALNNNQLDIDPHLLQYLVANNDTNKFKKLLDVFYIDVNTEYNGKTLMCTAMENHHMEMVQLLTKEKLLQLESKHNVEINEIKKLNSKLSLDNNKLQLEKAKLAAENKTLTRELDNSNTNKNAFVFFVGLFFAAFMYGLI